MKSSTLLCSLFTALLSANTWAITTNNLVYSFDFNRQPTDTTPPLCTYGSNNTRALNPSQLVCVPANLTWHPSGGVADSGYIRTKAVKADCFKITAPPQLPLNCTDFTVSFNTRSYSGNGAAVFTINGATVNNGWSVWGVVSGSGSWKNPDGTPTDTAPAFNKTATWQSIACAFKNKTLTLYIDGKNRGSFTYTGSFSGSPKLTSFGLGVSGTSGPTAVEADFDNIAIWNKAIASEEEARDIANASTPSQIQNTPAKLAGSILHRAWNYNSQEDSYFTQQNTNPTSSGANPDPKIVFKDGQLKITVRGGSGDRRKLRTDLNATTGRYKWRLCLPKRDGNSNMSVGAFIYNNDQCEIDFEIASGKAAERAKYKAKDDELLAYMTNQAFPFHSTAVPIKPGWHTVEIDVSDKNGNIFIQWFIDGERVKTLDTTLSSSSVFSVVSSVENLGFAGDHPPSATTTVSFDKAEYYYHP